ncbi:MAG: 50S ribosomal protein L21 [Candidatus Dasytiphilus stammeri]
MYAVFKTGGKQYRAGKGQELLIEKLNIPAGNIIEFSQVLMIFKDSEMLIGSPFVSGISVTAEVLGHLRGDKIKILKFKRRKNYRKIQGHRQWLTSLRITDIITNN